MCILYTSNSYYKTLLKKQFLREKWIKLFVYMQVWNITGVGLWCFLIFQHGLIHTGDTTYFIEPVRQPKNVTNGHPHIIYQHKPRTESEHNNRHTSDTCGNNGTLNPPPSLSLSLSPNISLENRECTLQTQCDSGFLINHSKLLCHE